MESEWIGASVEFRIECEENLLILVSLHRHTNRLLSVDIPQADIGDTRSENNRSCMAMNFADYAVKHVLAAPQACEYILAQENAIARRVFRKPLRATLRSLRHTHSVTERSAHRKILNPTFFSSSLTGRVTRS